MASALKEANENITNALENQMDRYGAAAYICQQLHELSKTTALSLDGDTHMVLVTGSREKLQPLIDEGMLAEEDFNEEGCGECEGCLGNCDEDEEEEDPEPKKDPPLVN